MFSSSMLWLVVQAAATDSTWPRIHAAALAFPDTAAARAAGFVPLARGQVQDLSPFQGQHWFRRDRLLEHETRVDAPSFVMFVPMNGVMKPVGLAYSARIGHDEPVPRELDGVETPWHLHQMCLRIPGEGGALADGVDDCRAQGGTPTPRQIAMVHAWTGSPSPEGRYAHDNVALPYLAVGLAAPAAADLADPERAGRARQLGLALGETYGARLPYARRVELMNQDARLADSLARRRSALGALVPGLVAAQQDGDRAKWDELAARAVAEWKTLFALYTSIASTPVIRTQLERQHERALGSAGHSHH